MKAALLLLSYLLAAPAHAAEADPVMPLGAMLQSFFALLLCSA
jgi:hypothetical protein